MTFCAKSLFFVIAYCAENLINHDDHLRKNVCFRGYLLRKKTEVFLTTYCAEILYYHQIKQCFRPIVTMI